jgi:hypothetical protein
MRGADYSTRSHADLRWGPARSRAEIGALHSRVRQQCLARPLQHHAPGLQQIPAVAQLQRLPHALLDEQDGKAALEADAVDGFED